MSDPLRPIRDDIGSAAGLGGAVVLWALLGVLGASHEALIARLLLHLAAAAATVVLWRRLEEPGVTLRWAMILFIAGSLVGAFDVASFALRWW